MTQITTTPPDLFISHRAQTLIIIYSTRKQSLPSLDRTYSAPRQKTFCPASKNILSDTQMYDIGQRNNLVHLSVQYPPPKSATPLDTIDPKGDRLDTKPHRTDTKK